MVGVSQPGFPPPPPWWQPTADPGPIPLRPLATGELLGAAFGVVRRHLALLGPVAVLVAALSSGAMLGILAGTGTLQDFADTSWVDEMLSGTRTSLPASMYLATGASLLISTVGTVLIAGLAAACAGADAIGRHTVRGAPAQRLAGRIPLLLATSVLVGAAVTVGLVAVVVPGVLAYLAWAVAAPVAAMERSGIGASLRRSALLTRGHRGRVLGITLLSLVIGYGIELIVSSVALSAAGSLSSVGLVIVSSAVTAVVSAVTTSWTGAVMALLYIDIRVRTENLAPALRAFAAADRSRRGTGPALGQA